MNKMKVCLAQSNNAFPSIKSMFPLLLNSYLDKSVSPGSIHEIVSSESEAQKEKLINVGIVKSLLEYSFDESSELKSNIMKYFPDPTFMYYFYQMGEHKWVKRFQGLILETIPTNEKLFVSETIFEHLFVPFTENPFVKWRVLRKDLSPREIPLSHFKENVFWDKEAKTKMRIRVLFNKKISVRSVLEEGSSKYESVTNSIKRVIVHIHGGGFISMSSSSHQNYLRKYSLRTNSLIFSIDYPLAPKSKYLQIIESVFKSYLAILVS